MQASAKPLLPLPEPLVLPHGRGGVLPVHPGPWWWQQPIRVFLTRFLAAMRELASQSKSVTRHDTAYISRHAIITYPAAHSLLVSYLSQQEFASEQAATCANLPAL